MKLLTIKLRWAKISTHSKTHSFILVLSITSILVRSTTHKHKPYKGRMLKGAGSIIDSDGNGKM
jgi:hypothetical protein